MAVRTKGHPRSSGYERHPTDFYIEDGWAIQKFLDAESFTGSVHDPACGTGQIPEACRRRGLIATGADIIDRGWPGTVVQDFLVDADWHTHVITNPPYKLAGKFIMHALEHCGGKVAVLVRHTFLEGAGRYRMLFSVKPPARVYNFADRVHCPPGDSDVKRENGSIFYIWAVWDPQHKGETIMRWLP
jgi:hypothetical protein